MADSEQLARLRTSAGDWNRWRARNPKKKVDLRTADLTQADLSGADLIGADLRQAALNGAALVGAYLIGADLRGAGLDVADLRGADLRDADVRGVDLTRTFFLTQAQVETAHGDRATLLAATFARPEHWSR